MLGDLPLVEVRPKDVRGVQADLLTRKVVARKAGEKANKTLSVTPVRNAIGGHPVDTLAIRAAPMSR